MGRAVRKYLACTFEELDDGTFLPLKSLVF